MQGNQDNRLKSTKNLTKTSDLPTQTSIQESVMDCVLLWPVFRMWFAFYMPHLIHNYCIVLYREDQTVWEFDQH